MGDQKVVEIECPTHGKRNVTVVHLTARWADPSCDECARYRESEEVSRESQRSARQSKEAKEHLIRKQLAKSAIPARFENRTFDNYTADGEAGAKALRVSREYATEFCERLKLGSSLILCGNAGTGKTHLACAIAQHIMKTHAMSAQYMTVGRAFRMVKDTYRRDSGRTEQEVLSVFAAPDLLILDEIGVQYGSDTEKNILFEIVNERYEALKPTILISNLALKELTEYAGERVIDRMKENGGKLVPFDWKSHRGTA